MKRPYRISLIVIAGAFLVCGTASAQSYDDDTTDGLYLYSDFYTDAPAPGSCPTYVDVRMSLTGGTSAFGQSSYPNTLHVSVKSAFANGASYTLSRDVIHVGEQRGGNCGVFLESVFDYVIGVGLSGANFKYTGSLGAGSCTYTLDCDTKPTCPTFATATVTNSYTPCGAYWVQQYASLIRSDGVRLCFALPNGVLPFPYVSGKNSTRMGCT